MDACGRRCAIRIFGIPEGIRKSRGTLELPGIAGIAGIAGVTGLTDSAGSLAFWVAPAGSGFCALCLFLFVRLPVFLSVYIGLTGSGGSLAFWVVPAGSGFCALSVSLFVLLSLFSSV